jgi:hypothetical protein
LNNITHGQPWFVAVRVTNATSGIGIWFSSLCAPQCSTHGTCKLTGEKKGSCLCVSDYDGVDCLNPSSSMLGTQYIVLIIIASLVVASAIIGFVAWAYMRRRRVLYEKVG